MDTSRIVGRQDPASNLDDPAPTNNSDGLYYENPTAYAIKWAVIAAITVFFLVYMVGGYMHAQRRMKKGLPPLAYHRWIVSRQQKAAFAQQYPQYANQFSFYRAQQDRVGPYGTYGYAPNGQAYQMGGMYAPPPPAYNEPDYVPAYTPAAPNKVDPDQRYNAPAGPPPASAQGAGPAAPEPARTAR